MKRGLIILLLAVTWWNIQQAFPQSDIVYGTSIDASTVTKQARKVAKTVEVKTLQTWEEGRDKRCSYHFDALGEDMPFRVCVPKSWDGKKKLPLLMFLHGGWNTESSYLDENNKLMVRLADEHGYLLVSPLGAHSSYGNRLLLPAGFGKDKETQEVLAKRDAPELMREQELSEQDVINVLEIVLKNYPVDRNRLFLCGHSMGSGGTWFLGAKYADYWRALAPMSGPFVTRDGYPWQTCNCIGGWHYNTGIYEKGRYKTAETVVKQLVDIVSKNGNLLLSIPLRADGTYDEKEAKILDDLEAWMSVNGESIFGARPWVKFGEGPIAEKTIAMRAQGFNDGQYAGMDARDIRFNQTKKYLYVTAMGWPDDGRLVIKSLAKGNTNLKKSITSVTLLGYGRLKARQTAEGLVVSLPKPTNYIAPVLKITK